MIKVFFNPASSSYEVYMSGILITGVLSIKIQSELNGIPTASITAMVEIVNEKP